MLYGCLFYAAGLFGASLAEHMTEIEPAVRF